MAPKKQSKHRGPGALPAMDEAFAAPSAGLPTRTEQEVLKAIEEALNIREHRTVDAPTEEERLRARTEREALLATKAIEEALILRNFEEGIRNPRADAPTEEERLRARTKQEVVLKAIEEALNFRGFQGARDTPDAEQMRVVDLTAEATAPVPMHPLPATDVLVVAGAPLRGSEQLTPVALLGLRARPDNLLDAHKLIRKGLPGRSVKHVLDRLKLTPKDQSLEAALGMSLRTAQRHTAAPVKPLSQEQSGRLWKFAEVLTRAAQVLGSQEAAEAWLSRPATGLNQHRPIDLLATPAGVELVETFLGRLEYGVYT